MNSRQRLETALNHHEPDRVPLDLGGGPVTGMHVSSVYKLRQALKLDPPATPVKVVEPYQMLGEIQPDLMAALGVDVVGLGSPSTMFDFPLAGWKEWTFFDGTPLLVPGGFNTKPEANGDILMYPQGDRTASPSGRMPAGGYYFDAIVRQPEIDDAHLDPADNLEEFKPVSEETLDHYEAEAERLYTQTDKAILGNFGGTGFGDIALVPGIQLKDPQGIRDMEEWYMSTVTRRDYVWQVFEKQCEIGLENLKRIHERVGERLSVLFVTGTDFGAQNGPFISPRSYRDLYQPFHKEINAWVHANTTWKTFIHSCGSVIKLYPDFLDAGFDIFNPVQTSAVGMDPEVLAAEFGERATFWGGGVDTQKTLPFGTPEQIRQEVRQRMTVFGPGGGFVFNPIHNVQSGVPIENLLALYEAVEDYRDYPLGS
jgi:hypothetical protein